MPGATGSERTSIDVEELLVWVYRDNRALEVEAERSRREEMLAKQSSMTAIVAKRLQRFAELGTKVDGGDPGALFVADDLRLPPDADTVADYVLELLASRKYPGIVNVPRYAKRAARPDWAPWADTRFIPVWKNGPAWDWKGAPRKGSFMIEWSRSRRPSLCPLEIQDPPHEIAIRRREWSDWHDALTAIAEHFQREPEELVSYAVTGPSVPREPWNEAPAVLPSRPARDGCSINS